MNASEENICKKKNSTAELRYLTKDSNQKKNDFESSIFIKGIGRLLNNLQSIKKIATRQTLSNASNNLDSAFQDITDIYL